MDSNDAVRIAMAAAARFQDSVFMEKKPKPMTLFNLMKTIYGHDPINIKLSGRIPSKKNSREVIMRGRRKLYVPNSKYQAWHEEQSAILMTSRGRLGLPKEPLSRCGIVMRLTFPDARRSDLTNKAESVMDLLVDNGILKDDNHENCRQVFLSTGGVDKNKAGADITIFY